MDRYVILAAVDAATYNIQKATCGWWCTTCQGAVDSWIVDNPWAVAVTGTHQLSFTVQNHSGTQVNDAGGAGWGSSNTSIATVSTGLVRGVAAGGANILANDDGYPLYASECSGIKLECPLASGISGSAQGNVIQLTVQGNPYNSIFVGQDPNLAGANSIFATVNPTGGTFTESSNQTGDTFTPVTSGGPGWVVHTTTQSGNVGGRQITITYTVSGQGQVSKSLNVTAREFAYATSNSPSNSCTLGYGTKYVYTYTPYTHPDNAAVQPGLGLSGTAVTESFSSTPPAGTITGNGALNASSQFNDTLAYCSTAPLTVSMCITQYIAIEAVFGYQVRQNLLTYSSSGITLTNQGPMQ